MQSSFFYIPVLINLHFLYLQHTCIRSNELSSTSKGHFVLQGGNVVLTNTVMVPWPVRSWKRMEANGHFENQVQSGMLNPVTREAPEQRKQPQGVTMFKPRLEGWASSQVTGCAEALLEQHEHSGMLGKDLGTGADFRATRGGQRGRRMWGGRQGPEVSRG